MYLGSVLTDNCKELSCNRRGLVIPIPARGKGIDAKVQGVNNGPLFKDVTIGHNPNQEINGDVKQAQSKRFVGSKKVRKLLRQTRHIVFFAVAVVADVVAAVHIGSMSSALIILVVAVRYDWLILVVAAFVSIDTPFAATMSSSFLAP